jgi:uncharacterized protein YacL
MYAILLPIHHYTGWAVLLAGLYAITKSVLGIMHKRDFTKQENIAHAAFLGTCHLQLLLGLILYFVSPVVDQALANGMGAAMKDAASRFVAVEHIATMVIAIVLVQVGRIISKKQTDAVAKHKKALVFFVIAYVLIISRVPWDKLM